LKIIFGKFPFFQRFFFQNNSEFMTENSFKKYFLQNGENRTLQRGSYKPTFLLQLNFGQKI